MTNTSQSFKFNLATPNLFLLIAFDSSINHTQGVINLELIKSSLKFMLEDIFQWFLKTVNANIGKQIKCKWKLIFKISTILQTTLAQKNKNKGSCSSSVFRVHACFTVCLAHCLSICLGIIFVNTVWAHTQTQAHAHKPFITCPRLWIISALQGQGDAAGKLKSERSAGFDLSVLPNPSDEDRNRPMLSLFKCWWLETFPYLIFNGTYLSSATS